MSQLICSNCGMIGKPKTITKGSFLIELVLWLFSTVIASLYVTYSFLSEKEIDL
jgi:hypothetical protein